MQLFSFEIKLFNISFRVSQGSTTWAVLTLGNQHGLSYYFEYWFCKEIQMQKSTW